VISIRFNREIVATVDLCQVTRLPITLAGEASLKALNYFTSFETSEFNHNANPQNFKKIVLCGVSSKRKNLL